MPALDVLDGEVVRLRRGDFGHVETRRSDVEGLAAELAGAGASLIHLVDLDGARSGRIAPGLVDRVVAAARGVPVQASGGVRSVDDATRLLEAGAARVVIGTAAFAAAWALDDFVAALSDRLVVALDVRGDRVAVAGWQRETGLTPEEAARRCAGTGVARLLCTAIDRDGTLGGPDVGLLRRMRACVSLPLLAAGGVRSESDLAAVAATGCEGAIVGRALLDGLLCLEVLAAPTDRGSPRRGDFPG